MFEAKHMLVVGAGVSGSAAARIGRQFGAAVTLSDAKAEKDLQEDFAPLRAAGVRLVFGPQAYHELPEMIVKPVVVGKRFPFLRRSVRASLKPASSSIAMTTSRSF